LKTPDTSENLLPGKRLRHAFEDLFRENVKTEAPRKLPRNRRKLNAQAAVTSLSDRLVTVCFYITSRGQRDGFFSVNPGLFRYQAFL
jgi:hypothetical protein